MLFRGGNRGVPLHSPSLPDLRNMVKGNISWPEDLVDKVAMSRYTNF